MAGNSKMNILERIAQDPAYYALRILALLVLFFVVVAVVYAQTEFQVACQNGICQMRESDLIKLQQIINALVDRIQELQAKDGCV